MWKQLQPVEGEVDYAELEDEFAAKQAARAKAGGADAVPKRKMLLTMQRAQNVCVILLKLKMTPAQVSTSKTDGTLHV